MIRKSNRITDPKEIERFVNLSQIQVESLSFMMDTFGVIKGKAKYHPYDIITIPPNSYGPEGRRNKNSFTTTIGRWIFNKCFIEKELFDIFGYINKPVDKKVLGFISDEISYAVIEDRIPLQYLKNYLLRSQKYQPYSNILCAGFTSKMLTMSNSIAAKKKELLKKYKDDLADDDKKVFAVDKIEKELLAYSREMLKGDPSMDIYDSGAKGSFDNNFKNIFVMKGAVKDPDPTKGYNVSTSNLIDGTSREDYVTMAKGLSGVYSRSKKTQLGGYWEKLFLQAFQHLVLAPKGSDCHTKKTITITLTKSTMDLVMYNYIVESDGSYVELTSANREKYLNKTVKMRFSSLCERTDGKICNVCAGNMFYRVGFENVGTATPQVASKIKLISLKAFHDSTVKLHKIDVAKAFGF